MERMIEMFSIDIDECPATRSVSEPSSSLVSSLLNKYIKAGPHAKTLGEELSRFQNMSYSEGNILLFWKKNAPNFLKLAKVAKSILCIPMTSAKAEGAFSIAGSLMRKKRASITPLRAEKTLFIHDNYDILKMKL